ncbi:tryptophanyl-tRNA synthetase-like protein [Paenibacillus larvae subsp. larvae B-3650]|nr:tryptophanyl-tRNA synthetase-like protein [Paenibacillus larvae subsp. larvae B-3650]
MKIESKDKGYQDMYYGFLGYPVSQAADITVFKATVVPVKKPRLKGGFPGKNRVYTL